MKAIVDARRRRYARFLVGRGLEIGALGNAMPLPRATEMLYSDALRPEQIDALYPGSRHPDIVSDSERFEDVADDAFDFVVANHVLEHLTDPIRALIEWHRILKPGGLLFLSVPDKRYSFDHRRQRTPLSHIEADYHSPLSPKLKNECHLLDWAEHVEQLVPGTPSFEEWVDEQKGRNFSIHNHVWVLQDMLRLLVHLRDTHAVGFHLVRWSNTSFLGNEFNLLLRKESERHRADWLPRVAAVSALAMHPLHELVSRARLLFQQLR